MDPAPDSPINVYVFTFSRLLFKFVRNLITALGQDVGTLAFISDMKKGIENVVRMEAPIWKNLKKTLRGNKIKVLRDLIWSAANSWAEKDFEASMAEINFISPNLFDYLSKLNYKWAKKDFNSKVKSKDKTNNISKSFNSWISEHRAKHVVDLVDSIRVVIMQQRSQWKRDMEKWKHLLVSSVMEQLREYNSSISGYSIKDASKTLAEVEGKRERHRVDFDCSLYVSEYFHVASFDALEEEEDDYDADDDDAGYQKHPLNNDGEMWEIKVLHVDREVLQTSDCNALKEE
ncbi:hypothetical protein AXF42_Ash009323 [Apostasia shenzhenica]|uniref:Uncharacterized protein n=1 Tax=Apostasia shenzhenica TaxID=1088818 RepID=A0A2I0B3R7_9ASPA|nr:hypothetical protein AXF42_Ash009323 [Apostasia shenzhenica]